MPKKITEICFLNSSPPPHAAVVGVLTCTEAPLPDLLHAPPVLLRRAVLINNTRIPCSCAPPAVSRASSTQRLAIVTRDPWASCGADGRTHPHMSLSALYCTTQCPPLPVPRSQELCGRRRPALCLDAVFV